MAEPEKKDKNSTYTAVGCLVLLAIVGVVWLYSAMAPAKPEFRSMKGLNYFAMIVPEGTDPGTFPALAKERCGEADICSVYAWPDDASAARALPMTDREVSTRLFAYDINRNSGLEQSLWNCRIYPRANKEDCLDR